MKKLRKKIVIGIVMLSMMTMYGAFPMVPFANAQINSLIDVSDTLTDSDPGATATHTFDFTTVTPLVDTDLLIIEIDEDDDDFSGIAQGNVTCPAGNFGAAVVAVNTITCPVTAGGVASGTLQVVVTDVVNPAAGFYRMDIHTTNAGETVTYDQAYPMVAIVDNVLMTARVTSTLNFTITGTTTAAVVNGEACDVDTSASSTLLDFGTLAVDTPKTLCQELKVITNADDGYSVVVYQDDELRSDSNSTINSFNNAADGTGSSTPAAWAQPSAILDSFETYGHMGLTSDDETLNWGDLDPFDANTNSGLYVGFNGYGSANSVEVMYHNSPADGKTIDKGRTLVAYTAEVSSLQEAGDYETVLTYVATPVY
ncbi:hypothetical protein C0584_03335 [Candidatus Parcubacteria bacterium]|nr:MAG: hypothetical protein C0584_03335 [Candidatus Parcubacteria bacterium]